MSQMDQDQNVSSSALVMGFSVATFVIFLFLQIFLLFFMIWFSISVLQRCQNKPFWLSPTIIILLLLWIFIGWYPGIGFALFIVLLLLLMYFSAKCGSTIQKKK